MAAARRSERVLLVHPGIYDDVDPRIFPPWGIIGVGKALIDSGHDVLVCDLNGADITVTMTDLLAQFQPTIVGVTCKLGNGARRFRSLAEICQRDAPQVSIVAGGPLVGSFPDPGHPLWQGIDAMFWGDGEESLPAWLAASERPRGLVGPAEVGDLNAIGIPGWWPELGSYVRPAEYWPNMEFAGMHVASARGCTRRCTFCYLNSQYTGARFRYVSAARLYTDLQGLAAGHGARSFYFVDDCFIDRPLRRLTEFCALNAGDGSPFRYGCDVQLTDLQRPDLLARMHDAGFRALYVGIETASAAVRKRLAKGSISAPVSDLVNRTLDMGFVIRASIGIGWPGETLDDMKATIALIDQTPRLAFDAYRYFPLPGTPLGEQSYWARRAGSRAGDLQAAFEDYSEFNRNYSGVPDAEYEQMWQEMMARERDRLKAYLSPTWPAAAG